MLVCPAVDDGPDLMALVSQWERCCWSVFKNTKWEVTIMHVGFLFGVIKMFLN